METQAEYTITPPAMQSQDIGKLAEALGKAQAEMGAAKKDAKNPFFKSDYATLASCIAAGNPALNKNGLSVTQLPGSSNGNVSVDTVLMHISGQWVRSSISVKPPKTDPQALGSCLTYLRRYSYSAIIGQATADDDDAESVMDRNAKPSNKPKPVPPKETDFLSTMRGYYTTLGKDLFDEVLAEQKVKSVKDVTDKATQTKLAEAMEFLKSSMEPKDAA